MLTDTKIKQAKVTDKPYKIYDSEGLYIEVAPTGSKRWRWRYRWNGKEKLLSFGIYPEVPLKLARARRAAAKELLVSGVDPSQARKEEKVERAARRRTLLRRWRRSGTPCTLCRGRSTTRGWCGAGLTNT